MSVQNNELDSVQALEEHLASGRPLQRCIIQSVDLSAAGGLLRRVDPAGALFLGCELTAADEQSLRHRGALVFPRLPDLPFNPYRPGLYSPAELYDTIANGGAYADSVDALVYAWHRAQGIRPGIDATLSMALHDHAISDALDEFCASHADEMSIGIMGGHAAVRGSDEFRAAARLAGRLTREGRLVMTGGGPGAMEAGNLGAYLAHQGEAVDEACDVLATAPDFHHDISAWARAAFEVRSRWPQGAVSLGIPTWFYGHEPPNAFATGVAKYFSNAIREDTLLARCKGGIVYIAGAAGTVQEVFQAATGNYYAAAGTRTAPMVLVGVDHWTKRLPAWPLLEALGRDKQMGTALFLVDSVDEAAEVLLGVQPGEQPPRA